MLVVFAHMKFGRNLVSNDIKLLFCDVFLFDIKGTIYDIIIALLLVGDKQDRKNVGGIDGYC
jgi:hypothetical protein